MLQRSVLSAQRWVPHLIGTGRNLLLSRLSRTSGVYVLTNVVNRAIPFLLLPVLTRYLTPEDYGIVAMYTVALGIAAPLVGMATDAAIGRQYFERDSLDFPNYVANCLYIAVASTLVLAVVVLLFGSHIGELFSVPERWVWTLVPLALMRYLGATLLVLWQMQLKPKQYGAFSAAQTFLTVGVSLGLIVGLGFGWQGRIIGDLAAAGVTGTVAIVVLVRGGWIRHGRNRTHVEHALRYAGGLIPHIYGALLIGATDRVFITNMVGVAETGLYAVGVQVASLITVMEHSFNQAWAPWLFGALKEGDAERLSRISSFIRIYNVVILVAALALAVVAPWLLGFLVSAEFAGSVQFVFWLALGAAFSGMYKMVVNQIFYVNRTYLLAMVTLVTGLVNVVLNYVLIRAHGAVGAAQATALSLFLSYAMTAHLSASVEPRLAGKYIWR